MGRTPRCLTIATSDSGGGAGVQADLKAFAAAGCFGTSVVVALTAQNTRGVASTYELPPEFIQAQLNAVFDDIGADAIKTGALSSAWVIDAVAAFLETLRARDSLPPLVIDPVISATAGGDLLDGEGVRMLRERLLPLASVVTPNDREAMVLAEREGSRAELCELIAARGAHAVVITGGEGEPCDHLFDGTTHFDIAVDRAAAGATHGGGCTHSATLCAELGKGAGLREAAVRAAAVTAQAIAHGLRDVGAGEGPVDVLGIESRHSPAATDR